MRVWRRGLLALALLTITACGSTVQTGIPSADGLSGADGLGGNVVAVGSAEDSLGGQGPGGSTLAGGSPGGSAPGTGAAAPGTNAASSAPSGPATGGPVSTAGVPEEGPGWDRTTVTIGVMTQQDVQAVAEGLGLNSVDAGDQEADIKAVVDDLNARGGLLGRKIVVDIHDVPTTGTAETEGQAACAHFTQDVRVVAVYAMALVGDVPSFRACMSKAEVPVFAAGGQAFDDQVFDELDGYYSLMTFPSWTRFARPFLDRLEAQGYYTGWNTNTGGPGSAPAKTGFLCTDSAIGRRVGALVRDASAQVGHPISSEIYLSEASDASNAVLRFRSDGITHVLYCDLGLFVFAQQAESQGYRPRYGISTFNTPILFLQGTVSNSQLAGSMGVGFAPTLDVDASRDPGPEGPPGEAACRAMAKRAGLTYGPNQRLAQGILYDTCDIFRLIVDSATAANALDGAGINQGVGVAGPRLRSAYTWVSGLSPSERANPASTRDLFFDGPCACYRYRGGLVPLR